MLKLSLLQKIALPLGAMVALLQLGLGAYALDHEKQMLLNQLEARAAGLVSTHASIDLDNRQAVQHLGATLLEQYDVLFCEVKVDESHTLFRGGTFSAAPCRHYSFPLAPKSASGTENHPAMAKAPVGTISLALSTTSIEQALTEARGTIVVAILAGTAVALLLATLTVRYTVGNSISRLLREVKTASFGHLNHRTSSHACDEFEQLAAMFNAITVQLQNVVKREKKLTTEALAEPAYKTESVRP